METQSHVQGVRSLQPGPAGMASLPDRGVGTVQLVQGWGMAGPALPAEPGGWPSGHWTVSLQREEEAMSDVEERVDEYERVLGHWAGAAPVEGMGRATPLLPARCLGLPQAGGWP